MLYRLRDRPIFETSPFMEHNRLLVIAPNPDLRKSLAFALEAEGYVVTSHAVIPAEGTGGSYDCVVLDHKAATGSREAVLAFANKAKRLILLAGTPQPWLLPHVSKVVATPLLGHALSDAVSTAINGAMAPH
jgi:hypothetical protein